MNGKWDKYKVKTITPSTQETSSNKWEQYKVKKEQPISSISQDVTTPKSDIENRYSFMGELMKEPATFKRLKEHPIGTPLTVLGGGLELAEAIPADIGLALQRGKPKEILPDIYSSLMGKRPAQLGDIYREAGVPEPIAAMGGLLASGAKFMPTELMSGGLTRGASKVTQLPKMIGTFGKSFMTKGLSVMSGIPIDDVAKAIDNPEFLNKGWLSKQKPIVENMYKNEITPYVQNLKNKVKVAIPEVKSVLDDIRLDINQQPTRLATTMKPHELDDIQRWLGRLSKTDLTLNEVDALIGEMDLGLQKVYKAKEKAKLEPISSTYQLLSTKLRSALKQARNVAHPDMAEKFDEYSRFKNAERIYENFDRWQPKLLNMAMAGAIAGPLGQFLGIPWTTVSAATMGATIPKFQAFGIRGASQLGKEIGASRAIPLELMKAFGMKQAISNQ